MAKRILHINCNYILSSLHQCLIERLDSVELKNDVFVATYDKSRSIIRPHKNVNIVECFHKWDRVNFRYKQAKICKSIEKNYNLREFDCIHAYTLFTDGNSAMRLSEKFDIPYVVAVRNTDVNDFFAKRFLLRDRGITIMRGAQAIFFLSESYRKQVFEQYVPQKYREDLFRKTHIVPNGIDDFWLNNSPKDMHRNVTKEEEIHLIYAGRIDKNKNIPTIQKAMKILKSMGINSRLTVVGRVEDPKEFQRICADSRTTYIQALPKEELIDVYRRADIFVMPSYTESFGLVYAEAMSQGLPVVYSKGQGFDGQFEEGTVGFHADARSPQSVAESIRNVIEHYSEIQQRVIACSHRFNWDAISNIYCSIYDALGNE